MNKKIDECQLCCNAVHPKIRAIEDTILIQNEDFICIPALGALLPGYVLIVSKRHFIGINEATKRELTSLNCITNEVFKHLIYKSGHIMFEHGGATCASSSSCIDHFHIHIAPISQFTAADILSKIPIPYTIKNKTTKQEIQQLSTNAPYLMISDKTETYHLASPSFPSQLIRRVIATMLGMKDEWNWTIYTHENNIKKTIEIFNEPTKNEHSRPPL